MRQVDGYLTLRWRRDERDGVSNHLIGYSTVFFFRHRSKTLSKLSLNGLRGPVNSPHKGRVTREMFPFDDVIMHIAGHGFSRDVGNRDTGEGGRQFNSTCISGSPLVNLESGNGISISCLWVHLQNGTCTLYIYIYILCKVLWCFALLRLYPKLFCMTYLTIYFRCSRHGCSVM